MLEHAQRTNQVIVTSNHDMVMLCADAEESVIWIDPRGRQFKVAELVPLVFGRVEEWHRVLTDADHAICLHVLRTKTEVLELDRARHLVIQRMRRLTARKRSRSKKDSSDPTLDDLGR